MNQKLHLTARQRAALRLQERAADLAALGLIGVGGWLRLRSPSTFLFGNDAGKMLSLAHELNQAGRMATVGIPSSKGLYNFPLSIWILQVLEPLSRSPMLATTLTALGQVLALGLCYTLLRRFYGKSLAVVSTALFATAPWAVIYSRFLWQQNWLPVFAVVLLGALLYWVVERRAWALPVAMLAAGMMLQLHFSGGCALALIGVIWVLQRPPIKPGPVAVGGVGLAALYAPFVWHVATAPAVGGPHVRSVFAEFFISPIIAAIESTGTWGVLAQFNPERDLFYGFVPQWMGGVLVWGLGLLTALALIGGAWMLSRDTFRRLRLRRLLPWLDDGTVEGVVVDPAFTARARATDTLLLSLLVPVALYLVAGVHVYRHYVIILYPVLWIVMARGLLRIRSVVGRPVIVSVALGGLLFSLALQRAIAIGPVPGAGVPLHVQSEVARDIAADARAHGRATVRLAADPDGRGQAGAAMEYLVTRDDVAVVEDETILPYVVIDEVVVPLSAEGRELADRVGAWEYEGMRVLPPEALRVGPVLPGEDE